MLLLNTLIAGSLIAAVSPLLGIFLVLGNNANYGDAVAHISLLGVVLGLVLGIYPLYFSLILTIIIAVLIELFQKNNNFNDSILVLFISISLALVSLIINFIPSYSININSYLFGSLITISRLDLIILASVSLLTVVFITRYYNQLYLLAFNQEIAVASGVKLQKMKLILAIFTALVVCASVQVVGGLLVGSILIIPVISSMQLKGSFKSTLVTAVVFSITSIWAGVFLSYSYNLALGGAIVICNVFWYFMVKLVKIF